MKNTARLLLAAVGFTAAAALAQTAWDMPTPYPALATWLPSKMVG